MALKPRLWEPIAWVVTGINIVGAWFAAGAAEPLHAASHAALAAVFALWAQRLRRQSRQSTFDTSTVERLGDLEARLAQLDNLPNLEARLAEMEERLDFTERALIDVRARAQLPRKE